MVKRKGAKVGVVRVRADARFSLKLKSGELGHTCRAKWYENGKCVQVAPRRRGV